MVVASAQGRPQSVGPEVLIRGVNAPFGRRVGIRTPTSNAAVALRTSTDLEAGVARVTDIMVDALAGEHATLQGVLAPGVDVTGQVEAVTHLVVIRHQAVTERADAVDLAVHNHVMHQARQGNVAPRLVQPNLHDNIRPRGTAADGAGGERICRAPHAAADTRWKELVREVANRIVCGTGGEGLLQRTGEAPSARTLPGVADRGLQTTQLTGESQRLTHRVRGRLLVADQGAVHTGHPGAQRAERDDDADVLERFADRTRIVEVAAGAHDQDGFHRAPR